MEKAAAVDLDLRRWAMVQALWIRAPSRFFGGRPMKNLLAFVAAAVLMFAGVGWYLDWFHILSGPTASDHYSVNLDLDAKKIKGDLQKGEAKVADAIEKARKDAAASKAAAGSSDPVNNKWSDPVTPIVGAGHQ
jgi:hypothetical protein